MGSAMDGGPQGLATNRIMTGRSVVQDHGGDVILHTQGDQIVSHLSKSSAKNLVSPSSSSRYFTTSEVLSSDAKAEEDSSNIKNDIVASPAPVDFEK